MTQALDKVQVEFYQIGGLGEMGWCDKLGASCSHKV